MSDRTPDLAYPILVTQQNGEFTLRVKELMLFARGRDLVAAHREIIEKVEEIVRWAGSLDTLDELPTPRRPGLVSKLG